MGEGIGFVGKEQDRDFTTYQNKIFESIRENNFADLRVHPLQ
jgi:hypothetical protein